MRHCQHFYRPRRLICSSLRCLLRQELVGYLIDVALCTLHNVMPAFARLRPILSKLLASLFGQLLEDAQGLAFKNASTFFTQS